MDTLLPDDVLLFLGAGFSSDLLVPMVSHFGSASRHRLKILKERHVDPRTTKDHRRLASELWDAGNAFQLFSEFCKHAGEIGALHADNMEHIFCIAEVLAAADQNDLHLGDKVFLPAAHIVSKMKFWLWWVYTHFPPDHKKDYDVAPLVSPYVKLIGYLKNCRKQIGVITTNYDLTFERFWFDGTLRCRYPFDSNDLESLDICGPGPIFTGNIRDQDGPLVCKLHGSVNFFSGARFGAWKIGIADKYKGQEAIGMQHKGRMERPGIFYMDALAELRKHYGTDLLPEIVPPTYAILESRLWLQKTWKYAYEMLVRAKVVVFIGYRMPESDGFMRAMMQGAFAARNRKGGTPLNIVVIDPCPTTLERYKTFFKPLGPIAVTTIPKKFADGIDAVEEALGTDWK